MSPCCKEKLLPHIIGNLILSTLMWYGEAQGNDVRKLDSVVRTPSGVTEEGMVKVETLA